MIEDWLDSPFTSPFAELAPVRERAHDPDVPVHAGRLVVAASAGVAWLDVGGAGLTRAHARAAAIGEGIERMAARPLPGDRSVTASYRDWATPGTPVAPASFVLFDRAQYALTDFPFEPLHEHTVCPWIAFRHAASGAPWWVPDELAYLFLEPARHHRFTPGISTGLAAGRGHAPLVLRGAQEVIERDAALGGWWGAYPVEEHEPARVWHMLGPELTRRVTRPNLTYRFYRVNTPFSAHVTWVVLRGQDRHGECLSFGAACRETRRESWVKALLESIQGRHHIRLLVESQGERPWPDRLPASFTEHAVYYTLRPQRLADTVLAAAPAAGGADDDADATEGLPVTIARLGERRPVLFRLMSPPGLPKSARGWGSVRVVIPGLQPLHGHHELTHRGGPLWAARRLYCADGDRMPPHPFP